MAKRQVHDPGAELDPRGEAGERSAEHQARRNVLGEIGEVLAAIAFAVAELIGEDEGLAVLAQRLGIGTRQRMDGHDEEAELHEGSPGGSAYVNGRVNSHLSSPSFSTPSNRRQWLLRPGFLFIAAACKSGPAWRAPRCRAAA